MSLTVSATALEKGLRTLFMRKMIQSRPGLLELVATISPSTSGSEKYGFLGDVPQMREFLNERKITGLQDADYTLVNKKWEAALGFRREDIDDDINMMFSTRINQLAERASNHPVKLVVDTLIAGTTDVCYDGVSFFNDAHPARGEQTATQDNLLAGTGTTSAQIKTDFGTALATMKKFVDEANEPFDEIASDLLIMAAPDIEQNLMEALEATIISNTTNVIKGRANVWITSRLTDADDWYMLNVGGALKPLVFQDRDPVEFKALTSNDTEQVFNREIYEYGVRARYNVGYLFWQQAIKVVN